MNRNKRGSIIYVALCFKVTFDRITTHTSAGPIQSENHRCNKSAVQPELFCLSIFPLFQLERRTELDKRPWRKRRTLILQLDRTWKIVCNHRRRTNWKILPWWRKVQGYAIQNLITKLQIAEESDSLEQNHCQPTRRIQYASSRNKVFRLIHAVLDR